MKSILFSITVAAAVSIGSAVTAEAGPRHSKAFHIENYVNPSVRPAHNNHGPRSRPSHGRHLHRSHPHSSHFHGHHAMPHKISTVEVNRRTHSHVAYHPSGHPYTYYVTVVTYCDHYSNGTTRTWSKTFS